MRTSLPVRWTVLVVCFGILPVGAHRPGQTCHAQNPAAKEADPGSLVTRGRVGLNLAGAERIISAARLKAAEMKVRVNIAVVDDGGHLLAFARMDQARPAS